MKRFVAVVLTLVFVGAACGGSDPSVAEEGSWDPPLSEEAKRW